MRENNFNYRSESIFSANRNLFEVLETIDDEKEAKRSAHFFNNNKNILLNLFKSTNYNNVNNILLEKKKNNNIITSKDNENKKKETETEKHQNEYSLKNNTNYDKKKWIKNFCWFCSLHLLDEILEKEIYKEKIHEHVYDLIYDEDTYFDTSSMMSIPYEFARFMLSQIEDNVFHKIKINNLIKEEKNLIKKICKNCTYNKKYKKMSNATSSNQSCNSISCKSDNSSSNNKKKKKFKNLYNCNYLNIHNKLNDSNSVCNDYEKNNNNKIKTFYDSNNLRNNSSSNLFYKKVPSFDYISNSNNFYENFYVENKKNKINAKYNNEESFLKNKDQNNDTLSNNKPINDNNKSSTYYEFRKLSEPILVSPNLKKKKKEKDSIMKKEKNNEYYKELDQRNYTYFDEKNKKERNPIKIKDDNHFCADFENINGKHTSTYHNRFLKRSNSFNVREKNTFMNKIWIADSFEEKIRNNKFDEKEEINGMHKIKNKFNSESCYGYLKSDSMSSETKNNANNYNERVYKNYKSNLNYIKKFYYIDETKKKPFPLCLYSNIKCYNYIKQCVRCCCFFNSDCCHCVECKKKYHMKLKNPHYFIFQHGLTASVIDFQNIINPLLKKNPHLFIYVTYSNQGHTFEGVDVGTERICTELICLFKIINDKINISMIGHSLGGILNRSVLINLYRKKMFKNKKLVNFITFACPHIGVHENMAVIKVLSTYLGAHTIDDLNNKTTLLLKIANVKSINVLKKFENIIFYGNTQSDWLVGIRTSLILPYTLFNEELILFIMEQAKNVPEMPINIFSVVHLYMRKKKLLFFYFYQDLKNPNYLLNKRKEQSKFLDQMLQTIISSRKLLSYSSQKKKFNIFMNYYGNSGKNKIEEKKNMSSTGNNTISNDKNLYNKNDIDFVSDEKNCKNIFLNKDENNFESNNCFKRNLIIKNGKRILSNDVNSKIIPFYSNTNSEIRQVNNNGLLRNSYSFCEFNSYDKDTENSENYKRLEASKSRSYEDIYMKKKKKTNSNIIDANMDKKCRDKLNKKKDLEKILNISENYKITDSSNITKNSELFKNDKVQNFESNSFMKEKNKKVKNENKNNDFIDDTINYSTSNIAIDNDTSNEDNINNYNNNNNNGNKKNDHNDSNNYINKNGNGNNDTNNNDTSDDSKKNKFGDYKYFEKLFFECLKTKIISEIKYLDHNIKKKKKKKIENNKLFSLQNTIKIIKNYGFLYPSKNNLKSTKDFNDENSEESKLLENNKMKFNSSNEKEKRVDNYENKHDENEHDLIHLCDDKNDEYSYINEFFYSSSDENHANELNKSLNTYTLANKTKNSTENIKCVECKRDLTINTVIKKKLKRSNLLKGITNSDIKRYKQILSHIYKISNEQLIEKFFKNPELLYYEVLFNCLNQLPIQRYSISIPIYSNAHVQIIAHPRICSEEAPIVKHFIEHLIL